MNIKKQMTLTSVILDILIILVMLPVLLQSLIGSTGLNSNIYQTVSEASPSLLILAHLLVIIRFCIYFTNGRKPSFPAFLSLSVKSEDEYRNVYIGVLLTSSAVLMYEILLTRIFSVTLFYHFAFMAVSVAVFGSALSGVVVYLFRKFFNAKRVNSHFSIALILMAVSSLIGTAIILSMKISGEYSPLNMNKMIIIYLLAAVPFFFGGMAITLALTHFAKRISRVYFSDLIGAGIGCMLIIPLLNLVSAPTAVFFVGMTALFASYYFTKNSSKKISTLIILLAALFYIFIPINEKLGIITLHSQKGKELNYEKVLFEKWNSFSRIAVYNQHHKDWSISDRYKGKTAASLYMDIDALASTPIIQFKDDLSNSKYLSWELTYAGFVLNRDASVFVIGPGGGRDLAAGLVAGAKEIDAAEINPIIVNDVMMGKYKDYSGNIYNHPKVNISVKDARSYIRTSEKKYDVILASLVDTWAASSAGAFNLVENNLYTVEAFTDFWEHLTDRGVLSIERWDSESPRLFSVAKEMAKRLGVENIGAHIVLVAHKRGNNFLLKKTPWMPHEIALLNDWSRERVFWVMYDPYKVRDNIFYWILKEDAGMAVKKIEGYPYDISPVTDNRPFFFQKEKPKGFVELIKEGIKNKTLLSGKMMFNKGLSSLQFLIIVIGLLVLVVIVSPMVTLKNKELRGRSKDKILALLYFGALGIGFINVEIALMQKFILLLGHPIYAFSVVLFSVLIFSGLGSRYTARWSAASAAITIKLPLAILFAISMLYLAVLGPVIYSLFHLPEIIRIIMSVLMLAPLSFMMGMPLPLGIKYLSHNFEKMIPWAWAVNGSLSVLGSAFAFYFAIIKGFNFVIFLGTCFYVLALIVSLFFIKPGATLSKDESPT